MTVLWLVVNNPKYDLRAQSLKHRDQLVVFCAKRLQRPSIHPSILQSSTFVSSAGKNGVYIMGVGICILNVAIIQMSACYRMDPFDNISHDIYFMSLVLCMGCLHQLFTAGLRIAILMDLYGSVPRVLVHGTPTLTCCV